MQTHQLTRTLQLDYAMCLAELDLDWMQYHFLAPKENNRENSTYLLFQLKIMVRSSRFIFDALVRRRPLPTNISSHISASSTRILNKSPFLDGSKGFFQKNKQNPRFLLRIGLLGFLGFGAYCWNLEIVPYTNRFHLVIFPISVEKLLFRDITKVFYEELILPPLHPSSIRVRRMGRAMVEAAHKGFRKKEEECMAVNFLKKFRKRDYYQIPPFDWEFYVVDAPNINNAECLPGGKINVFAGLLDARGSDAQLAGVLGHEVGHAIARHNAETISKGAIGNLFLYWSINLHLLPAISKLLACLPYCRRYPAEKVPRLFLMLFLYWKANLSLIPAISKFLIRLPISRRDEKEADYIGVMLMALAGYDPRVYVEDMEKGVDKVNFEGGWPLRGYAYSHPSNKKRAQFLSQSKVMEEAIPLYEEALMQRGTQYPLFWRQVFRRFLIRDPYRVVSSSFFFSIKS
ncbi:hypothetical protein OROHE_013914 [Orobanche hederae]